MADAVSIKVLEERFTGLQSWLSERFARLDDRFDQLIGDRSDDNARVEKLTQRVENHEARLVRLERIAWLLVGLAGFSSPVVIWAIIEIIKVVMK